MLLVLAFGFFNVLAVFVFAVEFFHLLGVLVHGAHCFGLWHVDDVLQELSILLGGEDFFHLGDVLLAAVVAGFDSFAARIVSLGLASLGGVGALLASLAAFAFFLGLERGVERVDAGLLVDVEEDALESEVGECLGAIHLIAHFGRYAICLGVILALSGSRESTEYCGRNGQHKDFLFHLSSFLRLKLFSVFVYYDNAEK